MLIDIHFELYNKNTLKMFLFHKYDEELKWYNVVVLADVTAADMWASLKLVKHL